MNSYIDDQVGRFLVRLEELGLPEDTIVIYMADHGGYMGEHHMIRKTKALYDCLCRIPLIISWPGSIATGEQRKEFVCAEDILPTLADLIGWQAPEGIQGMSFEPLLTGEGEYAPRDAIFGEHGSPGRPATLDSPLTVPEGALTPDFRPSLKIGDRGLIKSVQTREWKLVHYPGQPYGELYHLTQDPWELYNLYGRPEHQDVVAELRHMLLDWMVESEDCLPLSQEEMAGE